MHGSGLRRSRTQEDVALGAEPQTHRDEYFVRRLEAFGDIVIGFSLALLALTLVVPPHARDLLAHPTWLAAYVWTFALVCSMWGSHYWTFRYLFMPTRFSLALNYAKLALIVLLIFSLQVLLRAFDVGEPRDVVAANEFYWSCLASYWAVAGALLLVGLRAPNRSLAPDVVRACVARLCRLGGMIPFVVAGIVVGSRGDPLRMASTISLYLIAGVAVGVAVGRIAVRYASP